MPVMLVMDSSLPKDVNTVTLSYTFFVKPDANKAASVSKVDGRG